MEHDNVIFEEDTAMDNAVEKDKRREWALSLPPSKR